jgi:hypothetical protein
MLTVKYVKRQPGQWSGRNAGGKCGLRRTGLEIDGWGRYAVPADAMKPNEKVAITFMA